MKKALTTLSLLATNVMFVFAQGVNININSQGTAAAGQVNDGAIVSLLLSVSKISGMLAPIFITVAVLAFFWFLIVFITKGGEDGGKKAESMKGMGYSILALFVMVSIWGIIGFIGNTIGIGQGGSAPIPVVPVLQQR